MKDFLLALDIPVPRQYPYGAFHIIFMLVAFPTVFFFGMETAKPFGRNRTPHADWNRHRHGSW